jgi:hypothetical protein
MPELIITGSISGSTRRELGLRWWVNGDSILNVYSKTRPESATGSQYLAFQTVFHENIPEFDFPLIF